MEKRNKSHGEVGALVEEALATLSRPLSKRVILQVSDAIKDNPEWLDCYDELVRQHGRAAVNRQIGHSTLQLTGLRNLGVREQAPTGSIIDSYTLLG